jgi:hypothetical protein
MKTTNKTEVINTNTDISRPGSSTTIINQIYSLPIACAKAAGDKKTKITDAYNCSCNKKKKKLLNRVS